MPTFPGKQSTSVDSANPKGGKFKPPAASVPGTGKGNAAGFDRSNNNTVNAAPKQLGNQQ